MKRLLIVVGLVVAAVAAAQIQIVQPGSISNVPVLPDGKFIGDQIRVFNTGSASQTLPATAKLSLNSTSFTAGCLPDGGFWDAGTCTYTTMTIASNDSVELFWDGTEWVLPTRDMWGLNASGPVSFTGTVTQSGTAGLAVFDAGTGLVRADLQVVGNLHNLGTLDTAVLDAGAGLVRADLQVVGNLHNLGTLDTAVLDAGTSLIRGDEQVVGNLHNLGTLDTAVLDAGTSLIRGDEQVVGNLHNLGTLDTAGVDAGFLFARGTAQSADLVNTATKGTQASGTGITANATSVVRHFVHKVTVINTALAAAGTSDVTLHTTPVNTRILRVVADVTQVFTGGGLTAMTVTCGNAAGGNQYLVSNSVFTAQNTWGDTAAEVGAGLLTATWADFGTSSAGVPGAITVQCRFTCTSANCSAATQGSVTFYVEGVTYP